MACLSLIHVALSRSDGVRRPGAHGAVAAAGLRHKRWAWTCCCQQRSRTADTVPLTSQAAFARRAARRGLLTSWQWLTPWVAALRCTAWTCSTLATPWSSCSRRARARCSQTSQHRVLSRADCECRGARGFHVASPVPSTDPEDPQAEIVRTRPLAAPSWISRAWLSARTRRWTLP